MYTRWRLCAQFLIFFAIYGMTRHDSQKNNRNDERVIHLSDAVARLHYLRDLSQMTSVRQWEFNPGTSFVTNVSSLQHVA